MDANVIRGILEASRELYDEMVAEGAQPDQARAIVTIALAGVQCEAAALLGESAFASTSE